LSEYVIRILGRLRPPLTVEYQGLELPSFSITVDKEMVIAVPHPELRLDAGKAQKLLHHEISALLTLLEAEVENQPITFEVTDVIYHNFKTGIRSIPIRFVLSGPLPTNDELLLKLQLMRTDPTYRDLLELYNEAKAAPNPRPAGAKMKERLKVRFHTYDPALSQLDLPPDGFDFITKNQSQYKGDRHADYNIGDVPTQMEPSKRLEILTLLKDIIQRYEKYLLKTT
jgi:hypothetical protein